MDSNIGQKIMHATGLLLLLQKLFQLSLVTPKGVGVMKTPIAVGLNGFLVDIETKAPLKKTFLDSIIDDINH